MKTTTRLSKVQDYRAIHNKYPILMIKSCYVISRMKPKKPVMCQKLHDSRLSKFYKAPIAKFFVDVVSIGHMTHENVILLFLLDKLKSVIPKLFILLKSLDQKHLNQINNNKMKIHQLI